MLEPSLKQKTAKGLFWGGVGNGLQQLLSLAFGIYLARTLSSADYGIVGILAVFPAVANTLQESGFTAALTNKKEIRHEDYNAVFWFNLFAGCGIYLCLFFCAPLIGYFFSAKYDCAEITLLARVSFLGFLVSATGMAHNALLFKQMKVKEISKINLAALVFSGCTGVIAAHFGAGYWALVVQNMAFVGGTSLLRWHYSAWRPTFPISFRPLRSMFGFSLKLLLTNIVNQINSNIFSAILGRHYAAAEVGYYTQGYKWMAMGQQSVGGMINGIAQPVFAQVGNEAERRTRVLGKMLAFTSFIAFPALLGLSSIAPELILIALGSKWLPAVPYLQLLCVFGALWPILNLYFQVIISQGRSDIYLWSNVIFGVVQIAVALLMIRHGIYWMVLTYVSGYVLLLAAWQIIIRKQTGFSYAKALKGIVPYAAATLLALAAAHYASQLVDNVYAVLAVKIGVAAVVYLVLMKAGGSAILDECMAFARGKLKR